MGWTLDLLRKLTEHRVEFVIIGGVAAVVHGSPLSTEDLDLCAPLSHENAVKIITALADGHPRWRMRPDLPEITPDSPYLQDIKNMYLRTDYGQLDVLGELPDVCTYQELLPRTVEMTFYGMRCRVIDLDTLITAKRTAHRPKDIRALMELEAIQKKLRQQPGLFDKPPEHT